MQLSEKDLRQIALLISRLNKEESHHVGYCGQDPDDVYETLLADLHTDDALHVVYENDQLIGVLGLDIDENNRSAELWGPFIEKNQQWNKVANVLWSNCMLSVGEKIDTFYGFYHKENCRARNFMKNLNAQVKGEHTTLNISAPYDKSYKHTSIVEISEAYYDQFIALHQQSFPHTYNNGLDIINLLNNENKLFIFTKGNLLLGYVYVEGNTTYKEGDIAYVAVAPEYQKQGIGTSLVLYGLHFLFNELSIETTQLCVKTTNQQAVRLYTSSGFQEKSILTLYRIQKSGTKE